MGWSSSRRTGLAVSIVLLLVAPGGGGCAAEPPPLADGAFISPNDLPYASLARCSCAISACPVSGNAAVGPPDALMVDLAQCDVLDVFFGAMTAVARAGEPDIAIHIGSVTGVTRVEADDNGDGRYTVVAFIGGLPGNADPGCAAEIAQSGSQALIFLDRCNHVASVAHLRLSRVEQVTATLSVDAVEILSPAAP